MMGFEPQGCLPIGCISLLTVLPSNGLRLNFVFGVTEQVVFQMAGTAIIGFSPMETQVLVISEEVTKIITFTLTIEQDIGFVQTISQAITN